MKKIAILGSTGSIGKNTLDVIGSAPERYSVSALAAGTNVELLAEQARIFNPRLIAVSDESKYAALRSLLNGCKTEIAAGEEGVMAVAAESGVDTVVAAMVGFAGLKPTLAALKQGKRIALANKETLVAGGELVKPYLLTGAVVPIDSEHAALAQCLLGTEGSVVKRLILTASGGAFRDYPADKLHDATPEEALKHPNWNMGAKITVDSATLMNKGLEIIEAHWLFDTPYDKIDVMIHPQSVVHSLVEFADGSMLAQLGPPDMRIPIQFALEYPCRLPANYEAPAFSLLDVARLDFRKPDTDRFPCLPLAIAAGREGGLKPTVLNAANEVAVMMFLEKKIPFGAIPSVVADTLAGTTGEGAPDETSIFAADKTARIIATENARKYFK